MNKTHKKVLGLFGLAVVAVMTIIAATLPSPGVLAISSVTDTISVRVVGAVPDVGITGVDNGEITLDPEQSFSVNYENSGTVTITLQYTDADGNVQSWTLDTIAADYNAGSINLNINANDYGGYGKYVISAKGTGADGVYDEDLVSFYYYPFSADATWEDDEGGYDVILDYYADDGSTETTGEVSEIIINVYDEDGNLVEGLSPITVTPPTKDVFLPFDEYGLASGKYTIEITAYNNTGEVLYEPYTIIVDYEAIPVPNTGGLFKNLNISKTDYLITGLIIFGIVGIGGLVFINKRSRRGSRRRR